MRTTRRLRPVTAIAAALLLAGCGSSEPTAAAVGGDSRPTAAAVDKAALDTGTFPTMAQPEFGNPTPLGMTVTEGQRMAEFTVLPFEIDAELVEVGLMSGPLKNADSLNMLIGSAGGDIAEENFVTGFATEASNGSKDNAKSITHAVLRFVDNATATDAARRIHESMLTVDEYDIGLPVEKRIDALPNTFVQYKEGQIGDAPATVSTSGLTVRGAYIICTWAGAPVAEKDWTGKMIEKALQLQEPMIDKFPATPLTGAVDKFKLDQDGVLKFTVPTPEGEYRSVVQNGVYGPRGMAHHAIDPALAYELLKETGTDKVAMDFTNVYRAKSLKDAQKLMDGFVESSLAHGWIKAESPVGLADAPCMIKETSSGDHHACFVVNGRYMGEVSGLDNKDEVRQAISAQYLILEDAK